MSQQVNNLKSRLIASSSTAAEFKTIFFNIDKIALSGSSFESFLSEIYISSST